VSPYEKLYGMLTTSRKRASTISARGVAASRKVMRRTMELVIKNPHPLLCRHRDGSRGLHQGQAALRAKLIAGDDIGELVLP
jgi:hypothetical protein